MIGKNSLSSGSIRHNFLLCITILTIVKKKIVNSNIVLLVKIFCDWPQLRREIEIVYLLQPVKLPATWHLPFHFNGGGPSPLSLKLGASI